MAVRACARSLDRRRGLLFLAGGLAAAWTSPAQARGGAVLLLATIHGMHAKVPTYRYADVDRIVDGFRPDLVGVEIRQEDLARPDAYLARSYPREMIELARRYAGRAFGFDWLGAELQGRAIPDDYWAKVSWVKQLERELGAHPLARSPRDLALRRAMDETQAKMAAMVASATPASMNDGRYDRLSRAYYRDFRRYTAGTRFAALSVFYEERDRRLAAKVTTAIAANPGRRIAVVMGADHRAAIAEAVRSLRPSVPLAGVSG